MDLDDDVSHDQDALSFDIPLQQPKTIELERGIAVHQSGIVSQISEDVEKKNMPPKTKSFPQTKSNQQKRNVARSSMESSTGLLWNITEDAIRGDTTLTEQKKSMNDDNDHEESAGA
jgi:hypothetical protein